MARSRRKAARSRDTGAGVPPAELDVLGVLWTQDRATARQIRETMDKYRPMSHGAVVALLTRLEGKGLVGKEKGPVGKAFVYEPTRKADPIHKKVVRDIVDRLFAGDASKLIAAVRQQFPRA